MADTDKTQVSKPTPPRSRFLIRLLRFTGDLSRRKMAVHMPQSGCLQESLMEIPKCAGSAELPADPSNKVNTPLTDGEFTHEKV